MRVILFIGILATGCAAVQSPGARTAAARSPRWRADPGRVSAPAHSAILYPLDEALQDALSGPWEYLGTGPGTGTLAPPRARIAMPASSW